MLVERDGAICKDKPAPVFKPFLSGLRQSLKATETNFYFSFLSLAGPTEHHWRKCCLERCRLVIWGDMTLTSSEGNCTPAKLYMGSGLGSCAVSRTGAPEGCSLYLCGKKGRCIRKIVLMGIKVWFDRRKLYNFALKL
ncbi:Hyaluronidase-4 [Manis javanica]|nr:Hyaluronidase-4 [Manis javanica]